MKKALVFTIFLLSFVAVPCFAQKATFNDNSIPEWTHEKVNGKMVWVHNLGGHPSGGSLNGQVAPINKDSLMKLDIISFCKFFHIPSGYQERCEAIIIPLCEHGKRIFPFSSHPGYKKGASFGKDSCGVYIGTSKQNEILKRNIWGNATLIINGHVDMFNVKHWNIIE